MKKRGGLSRAEQVPDSTHHPLVLPPAIRGRCFMMWTDFGWSWSFPWWWG